LGSNKHVHSNEFIQNTLRKFEDVSNVVVVLDNAPCHSRAEAVFEEPECAEATLLRLEPYSPMLNPIENVFSAFKSAVKDFMTVIRAEIIAVPPGTTMKAHRQRFLLQAAQTLFPRVATPTLWCGPQYKPVVTMAELQDKQPLGLDSSAALMAQGPTALHGFVADKLEAAMGKSMPQMEVRFNNLSISATVFASSHSDAKSQLPTLYNSVKKSLAKFNSNKYSAEKVILKNASGVFKPGTITLLLGQPGSGKSSLMKVLSGRFPLEKNVTVEGDITYNGQMQKEIMKRLPQFVAYVTQRDKHLPALTVKETLEFAHAFCDGGVSKRTKELLSKGAPEENTAALETLTALYAHYPEVVMKQLGLENCQDTIVGNGMLRGVSGGERKRVTTGEMEFGMKYMTLMDEISTGLDSAATFDIINTQRGIAKTLRKTVVIALLQPAPEVFALFDEVMIMNEGEVMYHGPRDQALDYFQSLGF
ncbi:hypothetical protein BBJ28_00026789, partial [Nothophytophthora sp. Chile5]